MKDLPGVQPKSMEWKPFQVWWPASRRVLALLKESLILSWSPDGHVPEPFMQNPTLMEY